MENLDKQSTFYNRDCYENVMRVMYLQKKNCTFCDVVLKVGDREIYAHSNVLSAASAYFEQFLGQDLPRLFSQRSAQIIEIQIEGNEQSKPFEDAVEHVIDYIYTGNLIVKESNVIQVFEISKIMNLQSVIKFCEDFIQGKVQNNVIYKMPGICTSSVSVNTEVCTMKDNAMLEMWSSLSKNPRAIKDISFLAKQKSRNVVSVAVQTAPNPLNVNLSQEETKPSTIDTENGTHFGNTRDDNKSECLAKFFEIQTESHARDECTVYETVITRSGRRVTRKVFYDSVTPEKHRAKQESDMNSKSLGRDVGCPVKAVNEVEAADCETGQSDTHSKPIGGNGQVGKTTLGDDGQVNQLSNNNQLPATNQESVPPERSTTRKTRSNDFQPLKRVKKIDIISYVKRVQKIKPKKYCCTECNFSSSSSRNFSTHLMNHKFDQKTCFFCDLVITDLDKLAEHVRVHTGAQPFHCRLCNSTFKTRTLLNQHLPNHSDDKPFICEVCSIGFKWKQSLQSHMISHSNRKEHLCDICGYTTAWKAQLKAHKRIHLGKTFKCERPGCNFETTKRQNLDYHDLTHTGEKKNICDICGQAFSLRRNMRRHMLLHFNAKPHHCSLCEFASTRLDKLKEHMFKQHRKGTAPERKLKIADYQLNLDSRIQPTEQYSGEQSNAWNTAIQGQVPTICADNSLMPESIQAGAHDDVTDGALHGNVIAVIKDSKNDTYAILSDILNSSSTSAGEHNLNRGSVEQLTVLQDVTAQQVDGETVMEQLVDEQQQQHDTNVRDSQQSLTATAASLPQTIQIIGTDNNMQFINFHDMASRLILPDHTADEVMEVETELHASLSASTPHHHTFTQPHVHMQHTGDQIQHNHSPDMQYVEGANNMHVQDSETLPDNVRLLSS